MLPDAARESRDLLQRLCYPDEAGDPRPPRRATHEAEGGGRADVQEAPPSQAEGDVDRLPEERGRAIQVAHLPQGHDEKEQGHRRLSLVAYRGVPGQRLIQEAPCPHEIPTAE